MKSLILSSIKILIGGAIGQIIGFLLLPYIAHNFGPGSMGQYGIFINSVSFISIIITLRLEFYVAAAKTDADAKSLLISSLSLSVFSAVFLCLLSLIAGLFLNFDTAFILVIIIASLATGVFQILSFYSARSENFNGIALSKGIYGAVISILQIVSSSFSKLSYLLMLSHVIGQLAALTPLSKPIQTKDLLPNFQKISTARSHILNGITITFSNLANSGAALIPILVVSQKSGLDKAGWLAVCQRFIATPLDLISTSLSQVYISQLSRKKSETRKIFAVFSAMCFILAITAFLTCLLFSQFLLEYIPREWHGAVKASPAIALMYGSRLISNTFVQTLVHRENGRLIVISDYVRSISNLSIFLLFYDGFEKTISIYSIINSIIYLIIYLACAKEIYGRKNESM